MFFIYTILYIAALFFVFPFELRKRPLERRHEWIKEKFGFVKRRREEGDKTIWIHAVSLGEVLAAVPFIEALGERGFKTVISTITDTGRKVARERFPEALVFYLPFDIPSAMKRALSRLRPSAFVLMETELWPNAIRAASSAGVPVYIVNGRLSEKSTAGYKKARFFLERLLRHVDMACMQDEMYAQRLLTLGADKGKVKVTGNFKFDMESRGKTEAPSWLKFISPPVVVAGSTHRGEDEMVARAVGRLRADFPDLRLIIAPRHPERVAEAEEAIRGEGLSSVRSSRISEGGELLPACVVVDTVGELFHIYSIADVAVVCGSFVPHGGQNPLEPAFWGRAVVSGKYMGNFPFMDEMIKAGGAVSVEKEALYDTLKGLLSNDERRALAGEKARRFYLGKGGSAAKTTDMLFGPSRGQLK